jgi:hypothetical protein
MTPFEDSSSPRRRKRTRERLRARKTLAPYPRGYERPSSLQRSHTRSTSSTDRAPQGARAARTSTSAYRSSATYHVGTNSPAPAITPPRSPSSSRWVSRCRKRAATDRAHSGVTLIEQLSRLELPAGPLPRWVRPRRAPHPLGWPPDRRAPRRRHTINHTQNSERPGDPVRSRV